MVWLFTATKRIFGGIGSFFAQVGDGIYVFSWDNCLVLLNLFSFKRKVGKVTLEGHAGFGGKWPEFIPPTKTDSRCSCPAMNAMANHGILPRDGRNISFVDMGQKIRETYNFAPSFCYYVPNYMANLLNKSYKHDTLDLSDIDVHNGIEHDASLCRHDSYLQPDQSKPALDLIDDLLASATGKNKTLTTQDLSDVSARRRRDAKATNPQYTLQTIHKVFSSSNSSTMLTIFGGRTEDLEVILKEERLPEGWESRIRNQWGLTMAAFQRTVLRVELGIDETASGSKGNKL